MGIGSLFGALSLLGFLGFLAGIGLVVVSASQGRSARSGVLLTIIGLIAGVLFSIIGQGILIVEPREVAVVVNTLTGTVEEDPRPGGTHIILPVVQQPFLYQVDQQSVTMDGQPSGSDEGAVRARTSDGQEVSLDVSVLFSVSPQDAGQLHVTWQNRYQTELVIPAARGIVRDAVSTFEAAEIYAGGRETLSSSAFERLRVRLEREGLVLSDLIIRDITFSQQYADAIERAQVAAQEAERSRLEVAQRRAEAEQRVVVAEGERDAAIARAEGEAQAIVLRAQAEAEGLRLVSQQIAANPSLIQYQYIQTLADNVQLALVPSNSPFLFDFASLAESNPDFVAPPVPEVTLPEVTPTPAPGS
jgi:regulator of protease activity HflC (stomatin/prohibitin superfamily)